jgi:hypothetical protein
VILWQIIYGFTIASETFPRRAGFVHDVS